MTEVVTKKADVGTRALSTAKKQSSNSTASSLGPNKIMGDFLRSPSTMDALFANPAIYEDKIEDLRRAFQEYNFRFQHLWKSNPDGIRPLDIATELELIEDPSLKESLQHLYDVATQVGLYCSPEKNNAENGVDTSVCTLAASSRVEMVCEALEGIISRIFVCDSFEDLTTAGRTAAILCALCEDLFRPARSASSVLEAQVSIWQVQLPCGYSINDELVVFHAHLLLLLLQQKIISIQLCLRALQPSLHICAFSSFANLSSSTSLPPLYPHLCIRTNWSLSANIIIKLARTWPVTKFSN
ncbi:Integrator complex subunit 3 [Cichlidogyrus casuarinus]|uniref:Integrator complex subunit 3 n=1 Tax=Cichlidogyrus casuarinus TaxID=1844966 RepID=A0ABD2PLJ6_9PLAT